MYARAALAYRDVDLESADKPDLVARLFGRFLDDLARGKAAIEARDIQGKAIALWYFPFFDINGNPVKNTDFRDDEPAIQDVYKKVHGKDPSGQYWDALKWMQTVSGKTSMTVVALAI